MRKFTGAPAAALLACVVAPVSASAANNPCPRPDTGTVVTSAPHLFSSNGALNMSFGYSTTVDSAGRTDRPRLLKVSDAGRGTHRRNGRHTIRVIVFLPSFPKHSAA
jgi:hypothetical protein